jgi:Lipopolysaccharide-assembly, LptC-related
LISFGGGLYIFFTKGINSLEDRLDQDRLVMQMSADNAQFFEPNEIKLSGHVVGSRINGDTEELGRADEVLITLGTKSIHEAMNDVKAKSAVAKGKVAMIMRDYQMRTEKATYDAGTEIISSDLAVSITGMGRQIDGASGFAYTMRDQTLKVPGNVTGFFQPTEKEK